MSLDIKKISKLFQENDIIICDYFCYDSKCMFIKCYMVKLSEFLLLYIPSKYRFNPSRDNNNTNNIYIIDEVYEKTENDDYSKTSKVPEMDKIDEDKSISKYQELSKKYKNVLISDENDEPITRKLKRQIERLKLPFSTLLYNIAIIHNKYLAVSFDESISIYEIKKNLNIRSVMYFANFKNIIDKIEEINDHIENIKNKFHQIIKKICISNLSEFPNISKLSSDLQNYTKLEQDVNNYFTEFYNSTKQSFSIYTITKQKEEDLIKDYQNKIKESLNKISLESRVQTNLNDLFETKNQILKNSISITNKFNKFLLVLEETCFDNLIMLQRVNKNFEVLSDIIKNV